MVVYLCGSGGMGDGASVSLPDNLKQLGLGNIFGTPVWLLPENQKRFPCYVLVPQTDSPLRCMGSDEGRAGGSAPRIRRGGANRAGNRGFRVPRLDGRLVYMPFGTALWRASMEFAGLVEPWRFWKETDAQGHTWYDREAGFIVVHF